VLNNSIADQLNFSTDSYSTFQLISFHQLYIAFVAAYILSKIKSPIPGLVNISKFGLDRQLFVFDTYLPSDG